jgi:1,2-diacylglycerol 3-alpha-glucosyltransferase
LRIAMFTDTYLPSRDGVVSSILTMRRRLEEMDHEVFVFAPDPGKGFPKEEGTYYFRSIMYKKYAGYRIPMFPTNKCEILKELDVDVIHCQGLLFMALRSMFAGRSLKLPVVVSFHTMITEAVDHYASLPLPKEVIDRLFWVYLKQLLERAEVVITPTRAILDELLSYAPGIKKGEVIPTGVDCKRFHPDLDGSYIKSRYGLGDRKVILHLGRIAWEKNLDLVIEAFETICRRRKDVVLLITGEGPAKEHYMRLVEKKGIGDKVVFTGFVPDEELPSYYAACDVFALASKFETQGLVALEAMAVGKPVACINYRATAEVVKDGVDGYLFENDVESCADILEKAMNAPQELRERARQKALEFSVRKNVEKLVEAYEYAIDQKRARTGVHRR